MSALRRGRQDGTDRRRQRVTNTLKAAVQNDRPISVSSIARQARVDRTFLYRHRDLLALIHAAEREPAQQDPADATPVSQASLQADLANSQARNIRLVTRIQQLEERLSKALGEQVWQESGLGSSADVEELQRTITHLEQQTAGLTASLEEREAELEAARMANRQLSRALNSANDQTTATTRWSPRIETSTDDAHAPSGATSMTGMAVSAGRRSPGTVAWPRMRLPARLLLQFMNISLPTDRTTSAALILTR